MEEDIRQQPSPAIIKIALYGPESTGKTTLAKQLAAHFATQWVPEFARDYLQKKWDDTKAICTEEDLLPILAGQLQSENEAVGAANQLLFVDTTSLVTKVFSELYFGKTNPILERAAQAHTYDLFLLTDVDVPWQKDDLRDRPENREATFQFFETTLKHYNKPYLKISGTKEVRLKRAIALVEELVAAKRFGFSSKDFIQLHGHSIAMKSILEQVYFLKKGRVYAHLNRAAKIADGIDPLSKEQALFFSNLFDSKKDAIKLEKLVPASGAATRMFKFLTEFIRDFQPEKESINAYINRKKEKNLPLFLIGKEKFPFYNDVLQAVKTSFPNLPNESKEASDYAFIATLISESGCNFAQKPKGILPFHNYKTHSATPIEEHLKEAAVYACSNSKAHVHFTISYEHQAAFDAVLSSVKPLIEKKYSCKINSSCSYQLPCTDSLAFDAQHQPLRDPNGALILRPGGHGALLTNLNQLDADLVFIKNIDNVTQNYFETTTLYKKALAGILLEKQQKVFAYLRELDAVNLTKETLQEVVAFIESQLHIAFHDDFATLDRQGKIKYLHQLLNRPIRVCGMVKNEGEAGGGPFWVTNSNGQVFLQIVETAQIDKTDREQLKMLESATHFNPVDLVCGIRDYKGARFDLMPFSDSNTGFMVTKNTNGTELKAYELPGLWNGGMAKWLTVFVEVPLETFNPVKTVNDLLKTAHQPMTDGY